MIHIVYDKWLSEVIEQESYTLKLSEGFIARSREKGTDENDWVQSIHSIDAEPVFVQTKVSTRAIDFIRYLEGIGFSLVDTNVRLTKGIDPQEVRNTGHGSHDIDIRFAENPDREGTVAVAGRTFVYSRFHLDPWFSNRLANRIKAQWVSSYFDGNRGEQMVVASLKNRIIGFLQILKPEEDSFIMDLMAVDEGYQRRGIAARMINFAIDENVGINKVIVGTQIGNIPSIKLYEKMGFLLESAEYVFHFHRD